MNQKVIKVKDHPFIVKNNLVEAKFYNNSVGPLRFYSYGPEGSQKIIMVSKSHVIGEVGIDFLLHK